MLVNVKLDPLFRARVGVAATFAQELPDGATVADCVAALVARWPELGSLLKSPAATYTVFVNSRIVPRGRDNVFLLKDGDTLYLFEPLAGG